MLLILDLDETLILGREEPLDRTPDFRCGPYFMYRRPGLGTFLHGVSPDYELAVWSSGTADYVRCIVSEIFDQRVAPSFVWARERCTRRLCPETGRVRYIKDLKKVRRHGYLLEQVLMVDDDPGALIRHYGNLIRVTPYGGAREDRELERLRWTPLGEPSDNRHRPREGEADS